MQATKFGALALLLCGVAMLTLAGCGGGGPDLVPVSGQVLIDGEPVPNASIQVIPAEGRAAFGKADAQGNFTLMTNEEGDGCVKGTHTVIVTAVTSDNPNEETLHVPENYMELDTTDLTLTIEGPTTDAKLELSWDGENGPITRKVEGE
jgi:hypothetical protein